MFLPVQAHSFYNCFADKCIKKTLRPQTKENIKEKGKEKKALAMPFFLPRCRISN
jgi:hypothetical protein